jgi:hypothetical protein
MGTLPRSGPEKQEAAESDSSDEHQKQKNHFNQGEISTNTTKSKKNQASLNLKFDVLEQQNRK